MESTCTAVYISPNRCSYAGGKCLFKNFSGRGTDRNIRGKNGQNSAETLCLGISMSWLFSLRIPMSWDIEFLRNSDPYAS